MKQEQRPLPSVQRVQDFIKSNLGPVSVIVLARKFKRESALMRPYLRKLAALGDLMQSVNNSGSILFSLPMNCAGLDAVYAGRVVLPTKYEARVVDASDLPTQHRQPKSSTGMRASPLDSVFMG